MNSETVKYMQMALKLARRGVGSVEPNPPVGCVIVKANQVVGKGFHKKFGGPHAEINALEDCKNLGANPEGAKMYVTLEPCAHHGKTGPCTDAIIAAKIAEVIIAAIDPSQHVDASGAEKLQNAGIKVRTGICEDQAKILNAPFIKFASTAKSWTILKWAQTIDGKLAFDQPQKGQKNWISNELSRKDAHNLRRRAQAVIVGINTVIADDPLLTPRPPKGKKPTRIVLDNHLRIPLDCQLLATAKKTSVIIYTKEESARTKPDIAEKITKAGAELLTYPDTQGRSNLHFLLDHLSERKMAQLLVEGGPTLIASFLAENLADEIVIYIAPKILGSKGRADITTSMARLANRLDLKNVDIKIFDSDIRLTAITEQPTQL
ncbi:MAG: bifunctional diaminohydroxyphosphoribosylaminopyrimidine deaminase/5-amino-6-(5-phosphoribosylamino)uracil reductase RibD [Sedimentisphaerales bacterium]|nr:bifunctional diaminohydroxyphosphoribosylaminopyrimidine deaminase/5-amino-6-(5-phosphoribosylamino)uracil reductase RibD [Sedimentisphaerales bacterium]